MQKYNKQDILAATSSMIRNYSKFRDNSEDAINKLEFMEGEISRLEREANEMTRGFLGFGNKKKKELQELENIRRNIYEAKSLYASKRTAQPQRKISKSRILPIAASIIAVLSPGTNYDSGPELFSDIPSLNKSGIEKKVEDFLEDKMPEKKYNEPEPIIPEPPKTPDCTIMTNTLTTIALEEVASAPTTYEFDAGSPGTAMRTQNNKSNHLKTTDRNTYISREVEIQGILCTAISSPRSMVDGHSWSQYRNGGIGNTRLLQELRHASGIANSDSQRKLADALHSAYENFGNRDYATATKEFERVQRILKTEGTINEKNSWLGLHSAFYRSLSGDIGSYISQAQKLSQNTRRTNGFIPLLPLSSKSK